MPYRFVRYKPAARHSRPASLVPNGCANNRRGRCAGPSAAAFSAVGIKRNTIRTEYRRLRRKVALLLVSIGQRAGFYLAGFLHPAVERIYADNRTGRRSGDLPTKNSPPTCQISFTTMVATGWPAAARPPPRRAGLHRPGLRAQDKRRTCHCRNVRRRERALGPPAQAMPLLASAFSKQLF